MTDRYPYIRGRLHSPHFIYLNDPTMRYRKVLKQLGIPHAVRLPQRVSGLLVYGVYVTRCDHWIHVAEGWDYTLWHREDRFDLLQWISLTCDVFTFSVGESDASYDFALFQGGSVRRLQEVRSPRYSDRVLHRSIGDPLPCESEALWQSDGSAIGFRIAQSLGIDLEVQDRPLYTYTFPPPPPRYRLVPFDELMGKKEP